MSAGKDFLNKVQNPDAIKLNIDTFDIKDIKNFFVVKTKIKKKKHKTTYRENKILTYHI